MEMIFHLVSFLIFFPFFFRKNFVETVFYSSDQTTYDSRNGPFLFKKPEAITQGKSASHLNFQDLLFGYKEAITVSQKKLIIQPNLPHFLRAGDHIEIPVKIINMTDSELTGQVLLQLFDPETHQPVDGWFSNRQANQYFTAEARQNATISFPIDVPYEYNRLLDYRVEAKTISAADKISGESAIAENEEGLLPVLPNRILITKSIPLNMTQGGTRDFHFGNLLDKGNNESVSQHVFMVEFAGNPAWYALQSLPYLTEFRFDCTEQIFNRFYGNALGIAILTNSSAIREVIEKWKEENSSRVQFNSDLKAVLIEETPWVLAAKNDVQQHQYLADFMDMPRLKEELNIALNKLETLQSPAGGFAWFKGEPEDRYITQYIVISIGRLRKMGGIGLEYVERLNRLAAKSMAWLDQKILEDFDVQMKKRTTSGGILLSPLQIQWLYMRSFFPELALSKQVSNVLEFFSKKAAAAWLQHNKMLQAMIAVWMQREGKKNEARQLLASIKKNAIHNEELGMYWKDVQAGIHWYQSVPETISLLIEAFAEINQDNQSVTELKTWLLSQKQSIHWATTRSTADACYTLLFQEGIWFAPLPRLNIQLGNKELPVPSDKTPGLGYFSTSIFPPFIKPGMGNIRVTLAPSAGEKKLSPAWGAAYWQYFDEMDRAKTGNGKTGPLFLKKSIFLNKNTGQLEPITENGSLKPGDRLTVRIELYADRDLDYVQLKDQWASGMELVDTLSGFKLQGALGYYETTRDTGINFFISRLTKGTHVFKYDLHANVLGSFSSGNATVQCVYAPEFTARTRSIKINVIEP